MCTGTEILGETATHCPCDLVWVPSHCGVTRNEHVDKLAKQALTISLDAQVRVPIDYAEAKQRVKTSPVADKLVERMPENLPVSTRKAEVILAQRLRWSYPQATQWPHIRTERGASVPAGWGPLTM